jgi:hypothetical protein
MEWLFSGQLCEWAAGILGGILRIPLTNSRRSFADIKKKQSLLLPRGKNLLMEV